MENKYGVLSSSVDSQALAKTVEGGIIAAAGLIALAIRMFDLPFTAEYIIGNAGNIGITVGVLVSLYGAIRKLVVRFATRG